MTTRTDHKLLPLPPLDLSPITPEQMQAYIAVSGDVNPLHADPRLAPQIGFAGLPVPGMQVMAVIANYIATWPECAMTRKLAARFTAPILAGAPFGLSARIVRQPNPQRPDPVLRVLVTQNGRIAVIAEAEVELKPTS